VRLGAAVLEVVLVRNLQVAVVAVDRQLDAVAIGVIELVSVAIDKDQLLGLVVGLDERLLSIFGNHGEKISVVVAMNSDAGRTVVVELAQAGARSEGHDGRAPKSSSKDVTRHKRASR
jgi:hypothetical protein